MFLTTKTKRWENPYISKLKLERERVFEIHHDGFRGDEGQRFSSLCQEFSDLELEIGSGSGFHLLELAKRKPQTLFLGVEMRYKRAFRTLEKAREAMLNNVAVIQGNALYVPQVLQPCSISAQYINFPDPWERGRSRKHRLIKAEFMAQLKDLMVKGGMLQFRTDHQGYFREALEIIARQFFIDRISFDLAAAPWALEIIPTEFENLFRSKGLPIFFVAARA